MPGPANLDEEAHYKLLKLLERNPEATQREIALELGISLGKVNYCMRALVDRGYVKVRNFRNSNNKAAYLYLLTPMGIRAKAHIAAAYLQSKLEEYESLKIEIEHLKLELGGVETTRRGS